MMNTVCACPISLAWIIMMFLLTCVVRFLIPSLFITLGGHHIVQFILHMINPQKEGLKNISMLFIALPQLLTNKVHIISAQERCDIGSHQGDVLTVLRFQLTIALWIKDLKEFVNTRLDAHVKRVVN